MWTRTVATAHTPCQWLPTDCSRGQLSGAESELAVSWPWLEVARHVTPASGGGKE